MFIKSIEILLDVQAIVKVAGGAVTYGWVTSKLTDDLTPSANFSNTSTNTLTNGLNEYLVQSNDGEIRLRNTSAGAAHEVITEYYIDWRV